MTASDIDVLFEIKNAYYLGNFHQCITESQKLKLSDPVLSAEAEAFMYRSYIAQKRYGVVLDGISNSSPVCLKSVRLLAEFFAAPSSQAAAKIVDKVQIEVSGSLGYSDYITVTSLATVLAQSGDVDAALRLLHQCERLECLALSVQMLLGIHRPDAAKKEIQRMQQLDEDASLTQLATAQLNLTIGGDKLQEAFYIYQELADKYEATPLLLNGQAAAYMAQCRWEDADPLIQEALDKDNNCADTLVNAIVLAQHLGRDPSQAARYISQLKDAHKNHPWVVDLQHKEDDFTRMCKNYSVPSC